MISSSAEEERAGRSGRSGGLDEVPRRAAVLRTGSLAELVPYTCARVLVPEGGPHWLALGEKSSPEPPKRSSRNPLTFMADDCPFFQRIWSQRKPILIPDTRQQEEWRTFEGHKQFGSWLSVPLFASEELLGFLSVGHVKPNHFTEDHLRRAELLAISVSEFASVLNVFERVERLGENFPDFECFWTLS